MRDFRCPYCVTDGEFRLMVMAANGHYQCEGCGHEIVPTEPEFKCECSKCLEWFKAFSIR